MRIEDSSLSIKTIGKMYGVDGDLLARQYKNHISDFREWLKKNPICKKRMVYPENIGESLSMDETVLSQGELYTIITNKKAKGLGGSIVAIVKGTKSDEIITTIKTFISPLKCRMVKEITIDLSPTMKLIAKRLFPNADIVSDRFHVQKLMNEAISQIRIGLRWKSIEMENKEIVKCKEKGIEYKPKIFSNGDTLRQLLHRGRMVLMMHSSKWTENQRIRAELLFKEYPILEKSYKLYTELISIYNMRITRELAFSKLMKWFEKLEKINNNYFNTFIKTIQNNYESVLNFFINRSTNAAAESFNAKVKAFRAQFKGVKDIPFFLFRLAKIFA